MPKIIIYEIENVSIESSNDNIVYCKTPNELENAMQPSHLPTPTLACYSHQMSVIDSMVSNPSIDHIYIIQDTAERIKLTNVDPDKITIVNNNKALMRHLKMQNMHYLVIDASKHQQAGDIGLANQSFKKAMDALRGA